MDVEAAAETVAAASPSSTSQTSTAAPSAAPAPTSAPAAATESQAAAAPEPQAAAAVDSVLLECSLGELLGSTSPAALGAAYTLLRMRAQHEHAAERPLMAILLPEQDIRKPKVQQSKREAMVAAVLDWACGDAAERSRGLHAVQSAVTDFLVPALVAVQLKPTLSKGITDMPGYLLQHRLPKQLLNKARDVALRTFPSPLEVLDLACALIAECSCEHYSFPQTEAIKGAVQTAASIATARLSRPRRAGLVDSSARFLAENSSRRRLRTTENGVSYGANTKAVARLHDSTSRAVLSISPGSTALVQSVCLRLDGSDRFVLLEKPLTASAAECESMKPVSVRINTSYIGSSSEGADRTTVQLTFECTRSTSSSSSSSSSHSAAPPEPQAPLSDEVALNRAESALSTLQPVLDAVQQQQQQQSGASVPAARRLTLHDVTSPLAGRGEITLLRFGIAANSSDILVQDSLQGLTDEQRRAALSLQGLSGSWVGVDPGYTRFLTVYCAASGHVYYVGEGFASELERLYVRPIAKMQSQYDKVSILSGGSVDMSHV